MPQSSSSSPNAFCFFDDDNTQNFLDIFINCLNLSFAQSIAAPLERIKLVMQSQYSLQQGSVVRGLPFETIQSTTKRLLQIEGAESLWRGNGVNIVRAVPASLVVWLKVGNPLEVLSFPPAPNTLLSSFSSSFSFLSSSSSSLLPIQEQEQQKSSAAATAQRKGTKVSRHHDGFFIWFLHSWFQSVTASALFLALLYPLEFCRVALALDVVTAPNTRYLKVGMRTFPPARGGIAGSSWTCYRDLIHHVCQRGPPGGFGLYSGFATSVASLAIYRAFHILMYENISLFSFWTSSSSSSSEKIETYQQYQQRPSTFFGDLFRSWFVCTSAGFVAYPLDTVSKWCVADMALSKHTSTDGSSSAASPTKLAKQAFKIGGIRIFYHGALVNVMRNAVVMGVMHCGVVQWGTSFLRKNK